MTAIIVLGTARSGTSATAGTLHRLGVNMGAGFWQPTDVSNPRGYYEDVRFSQLLKAVVGYQYNVHWADELSQRQAQAFERLITALDKQPLWGVKEPRLCFALHLILDYFSDAKLIFVARSFAKVAASLRSHSGRAYNGTLRMTDDESRLLARKWGQALDEQLRCIENNPQARYDIMHIEYDELLEYPHTTAEKLKDFTGAPGDVSEAVKWLSPALNHHG